MVTVTPPPIIIIIIIIIIILLNPTEGPGWRSWYSDSLRAGRFGDQMPGGGEIFRTRPDRPWSPPSLLYVVC
jgi:preprotein translocase subunit SecG